MKTHIWLLAGLLVAGHALADAGSDAAAAPQPMEMIGEDGTPVDQAVVTLPTGKGQFWPFSYAMGYSFGTRLRAEVPELDIAAFQEAMQAAISGSAPQLDEAQSRLALTQFSEYRQAQALAAVEKFTAENLEKSNAFLAANGKRKGVKTTKSGLQYEVVKKGSGPSPKATDIVTAHYHGTLPDGTVFDSSREEKPVDFPLNRVIPGWTEGLQLMNKGAQFKFFIPPALAYGANGMEGAIPPNQALVFEVELIGFKAPPPPVAEPAAMPGEMREGTDL